jgi:ABC-type sulfate transport system permease subunit
MSNLAICAKWTAAVCVILISPVVLIFAVPFAAGMTGDVLSVAGTPAALALTATLCVAAIAWSRWRGR